MTNKRKTGPEDPKIKTEGSLTRLHASRKPQREAPRAGERADPLTGGAPHEPDPARLPRRLRAVTTEKDAAMSGGTWVTNPRLSWAARGFLAEILRDPPADRPATAAAAAARAARDRGTSGETEQAAAALLAELAAAGYLTRARGRYAVPASREGDVAAARIAAAHQALVRPAQPRAEAAAMAGLVRELITAGRHDPGLVAEALERWRARRAAGEHVGRTTLPLIVQDLEMAAASPELAGYAVLCPACQDFHRDGDPCQ